MDITDNLRYHTGYPTSEMSCMTSSKVTISIATVLKQTGKAKPTEWRARDSLETPVILVNGKNSLQSAKHREPNGAGA